ncbi:BLUF domain-containing protein [Moraxella sp. CTOTU49803]|uniref:BLUF domain-containing protein n=1 Tax=Moraxella sp. CTOTU49803 TaxID=2953840 RepID=UPI0028AD7128|nr:BLUF domain-containing protein [Moraxella sp. CTOTU49803]
MSVFYLIYTSKITLQASLHTMTLPDIYRQSFACNTQANVNSVLFLKQGNFLQYMEGSERTITQLFDKIKADKRHKNIHVIAQGQAPNALFGHWKMHCINLDNVNDMDDIDDISPLLGYFETAQFDSASVPRLLADVENYYRSGKWQRHQHTNFDKGSYNHAKLRRLGFKHRYFLWIQLGFLLVFLVLVIYWLFQNRVHLAALNHPLSALTSFLAAALNHRSSMITL